MANDLFIEVSSFQGVLITRVRNVFSTHERCLVVVKLSRLEDKPASSPIFRGEPRSTHLVHPPLVVDVFELEARYHERRTRPFATGSCFFAGELGLRRGERGGGRDREGEGRREREGQRGRESEREIIDKIKQLS